MLDEKKLLSVISGQKMVQPPIWFMRQAGRYLPEYREVREQAGSFWNLCFTPELACEVTLQPLRRFAFDAAIIFSDILIVPHALGQKVDFLPDHGPKLEVIDSALVQQSWQAKSYLDKFRPTLEALKLVKQQLAPEKALIGFSGAPWTLATYMLNARKAHQFEPILKLLLTQKEEVSRLITLLSDVVADYLILQLKSGADVVKIFDSWAGVVPQIDRQELILKPLAEIVSKVRNTYPNAPIIYFGREISDFYPEIIKKIPDLTLAFDQYVKPEEIRDKFQSHIAVQGNLDPEILLQGGEKLERATRELIKILRDGPYIFNLGHGILPQTPIAHVEQVIRMVKEV
ncbi:uroporphyrinogen decarboxylase [Candidatus Paracaedibacter symbiosus]|uniref:uroporphyrinogen decarboxylase n=1 Tax=Candidatus Paracaedibacter symbiosus TaxID=244582 RepID=UPI000509E2C1|nr:uroporphyrinogen decarboxylase [Candidatus Paracaedibacter symbiosus]